MEEETSPIGDWIYKQLTGDNTIKKSIQNWRKNTPKNKAKDILFLISIVGLWTFMIWIVDSEYAVARPYLTTPDGTTFGGNCTWMYEEYRSRQGRVKLTYNTSITTTTTHSITTTTSACTPTTTSTCPECRCDCPICHSCPEPVCECVEVEEALQKLLNVRPTAESPAYQNGFYDMRCVAREALGDSCPQFKEGPSMVNYRILSGVGNITQEPDRYCFLRDDKYSFVLNRTMWGWNDESCETSSLRVTKLR